MRHLIMTITKDRIFAIVCVCLLVVPYQALAVTFVSQPDVFTTQVLVEPAASATYYGELTDWPHTFEFVLATTTALQYQVATKRSANPVSLLLVRDTGRGVEEVLRREAAKEVWQPVRDTYGMRLAQGEVVTETLAPGRYKLEISNPENDGRYQLQIGERTHTGFFRTLLDTFTVHAFYGTWLTALFTWRAFLLILLLGGVWYWYRKHHA